MKKILSLLLLVAIASCTHVDRTLKVNFNSDLNKSNFGSEIKVSVKVVDDRMDKKLLGTKEYCDGKKVKITSAENVADLLRKKILNSLLQEGFKEGNDRTIEVHIQQLNYKASCSLIGKSDAQMTLSVIVNNSKTNTKTTRDFDLTSENKHFIIPLAETDEKNINGLFSEMMETILSNEAFLKSLL